MNVGVVKDILVHGVKKLYEIYIGMPLGILTTDFSEYGEYAGLALANAFVGYSLIFGFTVFAFSLAVGMFGTFGIPFAVLAAIIVFGVMNVFKL